MARLPHEPAIARRNDLAVMPASQFQPLQCDHGLRRQTIVQSLLADVFQGRYRAGQRLVTQDLAGRFGVSHTPIREALIALAGIGIVELLPNRGAVVRPVTRREIHEICQVRKVLECEASRRACGRISLAELKALSEDIAQLNAATYPSPAEFIRRARELDSRLHDRIAEACGNGFLAKELNRLKTLFRAFRDLAWAHDEARNDYHRLAEEANEHQAIVQALLANDGRGAARAMGRHILSGARYWSRAMSDPTAALTPENGQVRQPKR